jgi:branched-chain amino acid aminotransferase
MEKTKKIWLDGKFIDWDKAKIHILSHTLHYGGGVFEGIRTYKTEKGPAVFRLKEHIKRFFYSAGVLEMKIPFSQSEIKKAVIELIKVNGLVEGYIRPISIFGYGKMGLSPKGAPVKTAIIAWPWKSYLGEKPVKVKISKYIRLHPKSINVKAKICGHYVNSILASLEAKRNGFQEALLLDYQEFISEGPGENIFMVKKGIIFTPPAASILPGITRDTVIKIAKDLGIKVKEENIKPREIKKADEIFFSGTAAEICPIGQIDNIIINKRRIGPITSRIKNFYQDIIQGKKKKYFKWLTPAY